MKLITKAIQIAAIAHHGQNRKSSNIPYITHPYSVGMMLMEEGCREEVVCAGILHDTVEDTSVTIEEIITEFGDEVGALVTACSEPDKSLSWEDRKHHTITELKNASKDVCMIVCSDKLHNLLSLQEDLKKKGEASWEVFNRGKEKQEWYYRSILESLSTKLNEEEIFLKLKDTIDGVFGQENKS